MPNSTVSVKVSLRGILIYLLAAAFLFYEMGLQASPSVMTHELMRDFHVDAAGLGMIAGFYFYGYTFMQIPAGLLFDRFSPRLLITSSVIVCLLGAIFFAATLNPLCASLGRLLMGLGSAFAFIGVLVTAAKWFPPKYFAFLVGIAQLLAALGAAGGTLPLAAAVSHFGWHQTLYGVAAMGTVLAVLCYLVIRTSPAGDEQPPKSVDRHVLSNLRHVMHNAQIWWIALYAFAGWAPVTAFAALWGIPFLMKLYGVSKAFSALMCVMIWLGLGLASPVIGALSERVGLRNIFLTLTAFLGLIVTGIILFVPSVPIIWMFVLLFLFGIAASGQIMTFAIIKDIQRPDILGTSIGFNNMAVVAGGAIFQPLVGMLVNLNWTGQMAHGVPVYTAGNYQLALSVVPICFAIGLVVSLFCIRETYCRQQTG